MLEGKDYKYQLELTNTAVIREPLHVKTSNLFSYLFIREQDGNGYRFRQKGFDFKKNLAQKVRGNASVISAAHSHDSVEVGKFIHFFDSFTTNISVLGKRHYREGDLFESASFFNEHQRYHEMANRLICELDLGLSAIELEMSNGINEKGEEEKVVIPIGVHQGEGSTFMLPFFEESSGTKSAYVLLRMIIPVLESGGVAVLDETPKQQIVEVRTIISNSN